MAEDSKTGPKGGTTTVAPSGWQKTTVYLRPEQIRTLKQTGLDRDQTMSDVLRRAIDSYFGLKEKDPRLTEYQRGTVERILRERLSLDGEHLGDVLDALDRVHHPDTPAAGDAEEEAAQEDRESG